MKSQLTQQQIDQYQEQGFLIIEDFLDASELEKWRTATDEAVHARVGEGPKGMEANAAADYYSQVFTQCLRLADTHAGMHDIMFDPELGETVTTLAGVDGIRIWHDQALIKPPYGNPTAWHLDNPYWSFYSRDAISIWVPLDDATLANGCMWYLPGTHKTAEFERNVGIGNSINALIKAYPEWMKMEAVNGACPAGSAVFHNGLTAHGAGANMTPRPRRAMTCAYMPQGSTFNGQRNILPKSYFESLAIGDVLDNDEQNPLIWSRSSTRTKVTANA